MRILCIIDCLGSGGAQRQMTYLACGLKRRGHDVELFLTHPDGNQFFRKEIDAAGIPVHGVARGRRTGFSLRVLIAMRRVMAVGFDGVIAFQMSANGYAVCARLLSRGRIRILMCGERTSAIGASSLLRKALLWMTGALSDRVVANSHSHARYLRSLPGLSNRVHVVWNGYPTGAATWQPSCSQNPRRPLLLAVGRRATEKNGLRLIQALGLVRRRFGWTPRLRWAGVQQSDEASLEMSRSIDDTLRNDASLGSEVVFLGEVSDPGELYRSSDALILPSLHEGLPNVVCEAMLAGCPVIASDVCDHPLLLGHGERGLLCDPWSPESIADAIERFRGMSQGERAKMAERASRFACANLGVDKMVQQYEELLLGRPTAKSWAGAESPETPVRKSSGHSGT